MVSVRELCLLTAASMLPVKSCVSMFLSPLLRMRCVQNRSIHPKASWSQASGERDWWPSPESRPATTAIGHWEISVSRLALLLIAPDRLPAAGEGNLTCYICMLLMLLHLHATRPPSGHAQQLALISSNTLCLCSFSLQRGSALSHFREFRCLIKGGNCIDHAWIVFIGTLH